MPHTTTIEVRFGDCDPAGIVYYPVLYHYCHIAFEETWAGALGIPYHELIAVKRIGFPTVHVETDFLSRLEYGAVLEIAVSVSRVGRSSVVFEFSGVAAGRPVLRSSHTKVCVDLDTFQPVAIPEPFRSALEGLREGPGA